MSEINEAITEGRATCETCVLYAPRVDEEGYGSCRRHAPVLVVYGAEEDRTADTLFPRVRPVDVCGEWTAGEEATA